MDDLTRAQRRVYSFVVESIRENGFSPTLREIARHLNCKSVNTVSDHLHALERKGYLSWEQGKSRTLRVPPAASQGLAVPVVSSLDQAEVFSEDNFETRILMDRSLLDGDGSYFAWRVSGQLLESGLSPHDLLILRRQPALQPGTLGLVLDRGKVRMVRSERRTLDARVLGRVVGFFRSFASSAVRPATSSVDER